MMDAGRRTEHDRPEPRGIKSPSKKKNLKSPLKIRQKIKEMEFQQTVFRFKQVERNSNKDFYPPKNTQKATPRSPMPKQERASPGKKNPKNERPSIFRSSSQSKKGFYNFFSPEQERKQFIKVTTYYPNSPKHGPREPVKERPVTGSSKFDQNENNIRREKCQKTVQQLQALQKKMKKLQISNKTEQNAMSEHIQFISNEIDRKKTMLAHLYAYQGKKKDLNNWMKDHSVITQSDNQDCSSSTLGIISKMVDDIENSCLSIESKWHK